MNARELRKLLREVRVILVAYRAEHNLPPDYDLHQLQREKIDPIIDEFLCKTCSAFISSSGCPDHP